MAPVIGNGSRRGDDNNGDNDFTTAAMPGSKGNPGNFYRAICAHAPPGACVRGNRVCRWREDTSGWRFPRLAGQDLDLHPIYLFLKQKRPAIAGRFQAFQADHPAAL